MLQPERLKGPQSIGRGDLAPTVRTLRRFCKEVISAVIRPKRCWRLAPGGMVLNLGEERILLHECQRSIVIGAKNTVKDRG